ncbi:DUF6442 family protein [Collinsella tanakaei]|uniref:DUF6442 family protein n=1 Tax=Collinsella tanakaei TaxID=626935 RepID=UPI0039F5F013
MNRDEILSKSRIDNRGGDERERKITQESGVWGAVAMAMAVAAVFMVRVLTKEGTHTTCLLSCSRTLLPRMPLYGAGPDQTERFW